MTIKDLKHLIEHFPDEWEVLVDGVGANGIDVDDTSVEGKVFVEII